jgi:hypothetical protein
LAVRPGPIGRDAGAGLYACGGGQGVAPRARDRAVTAPAAGGRGGPPGFADRGDQWWARVCCALALLVELYRAASVEHSRLMQLNERSRAADLLALAAEVAGVDDYACWLARPRYLPRFRCHSSTPSSVMSLPTPGSRVWNPGLVSEFRNSP